MVRLRPDPSRQTLKMEKKGLTYSSDDKSTEVPGTAFDKLVDMIGCCQDKQDNEYNGGGNRGCITVKLKIDMSFGITHD